MPASAQARRSRPDQSNASLDDSDASDRRRLTVGPAEARAEADADLLAENALSRLSHQPAAELNVPHTRIGDSHIARSTSDSAPVATLDNTDGAEPTIGREGGQLDAATQKDIDNSRGSGRALAPSVRGSMESAFGSDFGDVRIHDTPAANRISRSISAEAFTTGKDVFFAKGAFDPESAQGQHLLAHELGHVAQGSGGTRIQRKWNPFGKTDEQKDKHAKAKAAKKELLAKRKAMKDKDAEVRAAAKADNAKTKAETAKVAASYDGAKKPKTDKSTKHLQLEKDFQIFLDGERQARSNARLDAKNAGIDDDTVIDVKEEEAADLVWSKAPPHVRAFRPLRFDDFDRALNEVRELMLEGKADEVGEASKLMDDNEKAFGAPMKPEKAIKKIQQKRALDRRQVRAAESKGLDPLDAAEADSKKYAAKADAKAAKLAQKRPDSKGEQARIKAEGDRKGKEEDYDENDKANDAKTYIGGAGSGVTLVGMADKRGAKVISTGMGDSANDNSSDIAGIVGTSTMGLGQIMTLISDIIGFSTAVDDIRKGVADPGARLTATQKAVDTLSTAATLTRTALLAAKEGVSSFGGAGEVLTEAGNALPIVGLIVSVLGAISAALDLIPVSMRLGTGLESVDKAVLADKAPLAAAMDRVNSRNAQLVEAASFDIAKNATMIGLHIAEIGSAGGFGVPMAARLSIGIISLAHSMGHSIYDTVNESNSSTAKKDFGVKHKEGASRDVLKYDIGTSVDVLIVATRKHKLDYARAVLLDYGATPTEIDTMRLHELREKILEGLAAEGDPKTVTEKIEEAKDSVNDALGIKKKPTGLKKAPKADQTLLEKVGSSKPAKGLAAVPKQARKRIDNIKAKHTDGNELIEAKNSTDYGGMSDRGGGSVAAHMLRDQKKIEKSFAKARNDLAAGGADPSTLPRTVKDTKKRAKVTEAKRVGANQSNAHAKQIDPAFIEKVTNADSSELMAIMATLDRNNLDDIPNLEFLEFEATRRLQLAGLTPTP
jgi:hypothetical protein